MGKLAFALCVLVLVSSAHAYPKIIDPSSLVGWWSMEEGSGTTTQDRSGNGGTGTLSGASIPAWSTGRFGKALLFNGSSSNVDIGQPSAIKPTTAITVSAWVFRTGALASFCGVVCSPLTGGNAGGWIVVGVNTNKIRCYIGTGSFAETNSAIPLGSWHHVVARWAAPLSSIYVDGVVQTTTASVASPISYGTTQNANIGAYPITGGASVRYWPGLIDEVRIYNRALSASEIFQMYQSGRTSYPQ